MGKQFTNIHTHIFTVRDAPDFFLRTVIGNSMAARALQRFLVSNPGHWVTNSLNWLFKNVFARKKNDLIERYTGFIKAGTAATQQSVFENLYDAHKTLMPFRIVVLTQVLDYLDLTQPYDPKALTQVEEVAQIKQNELYKDVIYPFLGTDPRLNHPNLLKEWVKPYISREKNFGGVKIYPAYGFFPFDERLMPVWEWAAENNVPVMTHCTRGGSWYLGNFDSMIPTINQAISQLTALAEKDATNPVYPSIIRRLNNVKQDTSIHKNNKHWCNIFGHPENYKVVLQRPECSNLKICLAHLGGANEIKRSNNNYPNFRGERYPDYLTDNWYEQVKELLIDHTNVYSDISYTISDVDAVDIVVKEFETYPITDINKEPLIKRLMYGTDFYLTQQEEQGEESMMQSILFRKFKSESIELMTKTNTDKFLKIDAGAYN